jgi:hypothetical protein
MIPNNPVVNVLFWCVDLLMLPYQFLSRDSIPHTTFEGIWDRLPAIHRLRGDKIDRFYIIGIFEEGVLAFCSGLRPRWRAGRSCGRSCGRSSGANKAFNGLGVSTATKRMFRESTMACVGDSLGGGFSTLLLALACAYESSM